MLWAIIVCCVIAFALMITLSVCLTCVTNDVQPRKPGAVVAHNTKLFAVPQDAIVATRSFEDVLAVITAPPTLRVYKLDKTGHVRELGSHYALPDAFNKLSVGKGLIVVWCKRRILAFRVTKSGLHLCLDTKPHEEEDFYISVNVQANSLVMQHVSGKLRSAGFAKNNAPLTPVEMPLKNTHTPLLGFFNKGKHAALPTSKGVAVWDLTSDGLHLVAGTSASTLACCLQDSQDLYSVSKKKPRAISVFTATHKATRSIDVCQNDEVIVGLFAVEPHHVVAVCNTGTLHCVDVRSDEVCFVARDIASDGSCFALRNANGDLFLGHHRVSHSDLFAPRALDKQPRKVKQQPSGASPASSSSKKAPKTQPS